MTESTPRLSRIEPATPDSILLSWSDGLTVLVKALDLRAECPCAGCVDEHTGIRTLRRETLPLDIRATRVEPIGRYALSFTWSDGHATGMHSFESLREICGRLGKRLEN